EYSSDLFNQSTITRMLAHYCALLESLIADPDLAIGGHCMLTEAERGQMLTEWNDTSAAYRDDKCIHQLLAQPAVRSPEAIAVVHADLQLTYEVLNERSNQLARHLMSKGVGPEVLVAACLDRSAEIVVALLGVLKAGGAYVPLDPGYPVTRLAYMLGDAG